MHKLKPLNILNFLILTLLLCLLHNSFGIKNAYATIDVGEEARLIGLMGQKQQWALIYFYNVQLEYNGSFHSVPVKRGKIKLADSVILDFENNQNISEQELQKIKSLKEFKGSEAEKDRKYYQYYLSHLKPETAQKYTSAFTPASKLKTIKENNYIDEMEKEDSYKAEYTLSSGEQLILQRKVLKNINAMLVFNENGNYGCSHNDAPICSNCKKDQIEINGKNIFYDSCTDKAGSFIKTLPKQFYKDYNASTESKCECYTPGFVMAAELKSRSYSAIGQEILITGHFRDSRPTIPPRLFNHTLYQTKNGNLIFTGTFVHTPRLNGSYYPFVGVYVRENEKVGK